MSRNKSAKLIPEPSREKARKKRKRKEIPEGGWVLLSVWEGMASNAAYVGPFPPSQTTVQLIQTSCEGVACHCLTARHSFKQSGKGGLPDSCSAHAPCLVNRHSHAQQPLCLFWSSEHRVWAGPRDHLAAVRGEATSTWQQWVRDPTTPDPFFLYHGPSGPYSLLTSQSPLMQGRGTGT